MMPIPKLKTQIVLTAVQFYLNGLSFFSNYRAGKKAAELFGTPRKGRLSTADLERLNTAEWHNLQYEDLKIQVYHWQGDEAQTAVLLHGWESNAARWYPLIKLLRKHSFNIIAFDAPAHGNSGGRYFEAVLFAKFLDVVVHTFKPQYLLGHSVGAYSVAYWVGHFWKAESPVQKLVLMASPSDIGKVFNKFLNFIKANRRVKAGFFKHIENHLGQKISQITAEKMLAGIPLSTLVIHDKKDDVIEFTEGVAIHAVLPQATFLATDGLGHRLRDNAVNQATLNFLLGLDD
jgi:pimeloyl-ACP methyl ester carboxylesterase